MLEISITCYELTVVSGEGVGNDSEIGNDSATDRINPRDFRFPVSDSETTGNDRKRGNDSAVALYLLISCCFPFPTIYYIYRGIYLNNIPHIKTMKKGGAR